jgi:hypothetical protein
MRLAQLVREVPEVGIPILDDRRLPDRQGAARFSDQVTGLDAGMVARVEGIGNLTAPAAGRCAANVTADTTSPFGIKISFHSERTVAAADGHHLR